MSHRTIEMLIGRLITDQEFRTAFLNQPHDTLTLLRELGLELTAIEIAALLATDPDVWRNAGAGLGPRLQKVVLNEGRHP